MRVDSRQELSVWFCELHNLVNRDIGKKQFDCSPFKIDLMYLKDCGGCEVKPKNGVPVDPKTQSGVGRNGTISFAMYIYVSPTFCPSVPPAPSPPSTPRAHTQTQVPSTPRTMERGALFQRSTGSARDDREPDRLMGNRGLARSHQRRCRPGSDPPQERPPEDSGGNLQGTRGATTVGKAAREQAGRANGQARRSGSEEEEKSVVERVN